MLSNSLKTSRSKSKIPHNIKSTSIQVLCPIHNQPVHKIQIQTRKLLCLQCQESNNQPLNLQTQRIKATALFKQFIKQFKKQNQDLQKTLSLFKQPNIPEIKRNIRSTLPQIQGMIDKKLQQQLDKGNQLLGKQIQAQLKQWKFLSESGSVTIDSLEQLNQMLNYKQIFEKSRTRLNTVKAEIKKNMIIEIKKLVRQYYEKHLII